ncbi:hypothetical protein AB0A95_30455, partial [Micromonospora sp. NPDC049230]|uniref:hypothetical protein n=1 Tax=Micromonospora sp. NPDC049230 TaxID=3155502 RepID=UPI0033DF2CCE
YVPWTADQPAPAPGRVPAQRRPPGRPGRRDRDRADQVAPRTLATLRPPVELPGAELPAGFAGDGVGYVVPLPATDAQGAAAGELDRWLREHGFPIGMVPFPVRLVVNGTGVAVQCRTGGPGTPRVWRYAGRLRYLDDRLVDSLCADVIVGSAVRELIGEAAPSRDLSTA